jgi:hypothetical protein
MYGLGGIFADSGVERVAIPMLEQGILGQRVAIFKIVDDEASIAWIDLVHVEASLKCNRRQE